jgi:hypothetical protein
MKIRSITCFTNPGWPLQPERLKAAARLISAARAALTEAGYEVQTTRLATIPFPDLLGQHISKLPHLAQELESAAQAQGISYVALGPALPGQPESYRVIPDAIAATQNAFFSAAMTTSTRAVSLPAVRLCAEIIQRTAPITLDGFANLRFAALANVPPGGPFFPSAYHAGDDLTFALAIESADLAVDAFGQGESLSDARQLLVDSITHHGQALAGVCSGVAEKLAARFGGIDFSLAQFPTRQQSIAEAMERLGAPAVGLHGTLAAAALLTEAIDQADFPRTGFCGLFMPVLEDFLLAERAAQGVLTVKDLLLYSAVCGTGLDCIPLPGDVSIEAMQAALLDLAVLAVRLDKPLTARFLPVPGKQAGDPTNFDFGFFANSRIMTLDALPLTSFLSGDEIFSVQTRQKK